MQYTLPVAVIILLLLMICIHVHFIQRIDSFGVNAGYYLSGDGQWAGQMQPAAASADGDTGLVPAPKAGQQNSYLRGDGKWIQANNAPTAAQYYYSIAPNQPTTGASPYTITWATSGNVFAGSAITQSGNTAFILAPGYAYRIIANVGVNAMGMHGWVNCYITQNGTQVGNTGALLSALSADGWNVSPTCLAYVTTGAAPASIKFMITGGANQQLGAANNNAAAWISIEVVSNNNAISPFTGSTASADGFVGYIPAPLAGQQNHVLTGAGKWSPAINAHTRIAAAGKQNMMFTNIPAYVKRITVILDNIKINSTQIPILQLGSGRIQTDNYMASVTYLGISAFGGDYFTDGFRVTSTSGPGDIRNGYYVLVTTPGTNVWICTGTFGSQNTFMTWCGGRVELPGALDQLKVSTTNGSDLFATGTVNVLYE